MNHTEFAAAIKAKHPEYSDMSDADLTRAMMAKFPQYSDIDTSGMSAPAPVPVPAASSTPASTMEKLFPYYNKSKGWGAPLGVLKDISSLPGRAAFATGGDRGIPMEATTVNTGDKLGDALANMGRDPWLIPAALAGEGVAAGVGKLLGKLPSALQPLVRIPAQAAGGAAVANIPAATESIANGIPYDPLKTSLLGAGLGAAGEGASMAAPYLARQANKLFLAGIKPRPRFHGGQEAEGLQNFLDKGLMPQIASPVALNPSQAGRKGLQIIDEVAGPEYEKAYDYSDLIASRHAASQGDMSLMIPKSDLAKGIEVGLEKYHKRVGGENIPELQDAIKDAWSRIDVAGAPWEDILPAVKGTGTRDASNLYVLPSAAKNLKKGFAEVARKNPALSGPLEYAMEGAADAARQSLALRHPEVAALNEKWAPWFGARDAFKTAAVRENRSAITNLANLPNSPAFSRGVLGAASLAQGIAPLARIGMTPSAQDATGIRP